jgi:oligopeptidase B
MKGHMKETDEEVPYPHGPYMYYTRTEEGKSYTIHCRREGSEGPEQVLLDVNALAEGHGYCDVGTVSMSPSHNRVAYTMDTDGGETYR